MPSSCTLRAPCVLLITFWLGACGSEAESGQNPTQGPVFPEPASVAGASAAGAAGIAPATATGTPGGAGSSGVATPPPAGSEAPLPLGGASGAPIPPADLPAGTGAVAGAAAAGASGAHNMPVAPVVDPSKCPAPDPASTPEAIVALQAINRLRVPAGANCVTTDVLIAKAATAHCEYFVANNKSNMMCTANPHLEVMGCSGFTGVYPWDRMKAAGFSGQGGGEVMYFVADPENAVATWANSVSHRISMLDPSTTSVGYGKAAGCDTMDFGPGMRPNPMTVVVYPYDGQTNLPTHFAGQREVPMPPEPPSGWPSGSPITIYAHKAVLTEHVLTVDGTDTPIEHTWLDPSSPVVDPADRGTYANNPFMYSNKPLTPNTKYRVKVSGTYAGGTLTREWTFTTGAGNPRGE